MKTTKKQIEKKHDITIIGKYYNIETGNNCYIYSTYNEFYGMVEECKTTSTTLSELDEYLSNL